MCCHPSFPEFCALVTSSLDQDSGPWVVSKISHFGITVSCSWFADVILCSWDGQSNHTTLVPFSLLAVQTESARTVQGYQHARCDATPGVDDSQGAGHRRCGPGENPSTGGRPAELPRKRSMTLTAMQCHGSVDSSTSELISVVMQR